MRFSSGSSEVSPRLLLILTRIDERTSDSSGRISGGAFAMPARMPSSSRRTCGANSDTSSCGSRLTAPALALRRAVAISAAPFAARTSACVRSGPRGKVFARASMTASGFRSVPIASRPASIASITIVPEPQNGSSSAPPSGTKASTNRRAVTGCARAGYA